MGALNTWHVKEPGEASGIGASFCICNCTIITNTLLEDSPIWKPVASINKRKYTHTLSHECPYIIAYSRV
jgi:hypothetical protein